MALRIKKKHTDIARDPLLRCDVLDHDWSGKAPQLLKVLEGQVAAMGLRLVEKKPVWPRLSKMSTTYFREIRLGTTYPRMGPESRVMVLAHELYHARQWRHYSRAAFALNYVLRPRWRWAVEVQAYAETVRAMVALGWQYETVDSYIHTRPKALWDNYHLRTIHKADVWDETVAVLQDAHAARRGRG